MTKNRLHPYEAGWLTFLVKTGLATDIEAREAMNRVAVEAADELRRRHEERRLRKKRRKPSEDE